MKPQILLILVCGSFLLLAYLVFEVLLFRLSCSLAGLARPSIPRAIGVVCGVLFAEILIQGVLWFAVTTAYRAGGYPLWEADIVVFVLGLPVHMLVCAGLHARIVGIPFTDGIAVWKVEKSIKLAVVIVAGGLVALAVLIGRG